MHTHVSYIYSFIPTSMVCTHPLKHHKIYIHVLFIHSYTIYPHMHYLCVYMHHIRIHAPYTYVYTPYAYMHYMYVPHNLPPAFQQLQTLNKQRSQLIN